MSNYKTRSGEYEHLSYFVGDSPIIEHLNLLKQINEEEKCIICDLFKDGKINIDKVHTHQGLYFDFLYQYNGNDYRFRWRFSGWIDMYDKEMNNLWSQGLHTLYSSRASDNLRFTDVQSLKSELER